MDDLVVVKYQNGEQGKIPADRAAVLAKRGVLVIVRDEVARPVSDEAPRRGRRASE